MHIVWSIMYMFISSIQLQRDRTSSCCMHRQRQPSRGSRKGETERPARMKQRAAQCPLYGHGNKTPFLRAPAGRGRRRTASRSGRSDPLGPVMTSPLAWTHPRRHRTSRIGGGWNSVTVPAGTLLRVRVMANQRGRPARMHAMSRAR